MSLDAVDAVVSAVIAGIVSIAGGYIVARGNLRTTRVERTLPPYDSLARRVSDLEQQTRSDHAALLAERKRVVRLEARVGELEDDLMRDRAWIKRIIGLAQQYGTIDRIGPLPEWIELDSGSMGPSQDKEPPK